MRTTAKQLAGGLGADERTLRRAVAQGTVRGLRVSSRRLELRPGEELYLAEYWPLLQRLRAALRTEPNVRLAAVFGSIARGTARADSDMDVLAELAEDSWERRQRLTTRLERALDRPVDLIVLERARRSNPVLLADVVRDGRVIVDRVNMWSTLRSQRSAMERSAQDDRARQTDEARSILNELLTA